MAESTFVELERYLKSHFPLSDLRTNWPIHSEVFVRYELGEPYENGTDERISQVNRRSKDIIEGCFDPRAPVLLLINDWENEDPMFGNTTPNYIYELLDAESFGRRNERRVRQLQDVENEGASSQEQLDDEDPIRFRQILVTCPFGRSGYRQILSGIANYEQGREPSIGQQVVFISMQKDIAFHMYDDRGCIVYSDSAEKIRHLYDDYNDWLVEYWREKINSIFTR